MVSAILLDAGGVLVFPEPARVLPPLRAAGFTPDLATLERAHYRAMAIQDAAALPPAPDTWWRDYLLTYISSCGVPEEQCEALAIEVDHGVRGYSWAHVGIGALDGLRAVAALGLPMGVVSNSDGTVESDLRRLDVCYAPEAPPRTRRTRRTARMARTARRSRRPNSPGSRSASSSTPPWSAWPSPIRLSSTSR